MARDANGIGLLKRIGADQIGRNLTRQNYQWDRIHKGICNAGDSIGGAGAGCDKHNAGLTRRAGITLRRMGGARLMPDKDMFDFLMLK